MEGVDSEERVRRWSTALPPTESLKRELCTKNWVVPATEREPQVSQALEPGAETQRASATLPLFATVGEHLVDM